MRKPFKTFKRQRSLKYILGDYIQFLGVDEGACASRKRRRLRFAQAKALARREESTIFFDFFGGAKDSIFCHTGPKGAAKQPFFCFFVRQCCLTPIPRRLAPKGLGRVVPCLAPLCWSTSAAWSTTTPAPFGGCWLGARTRASPAMRHDLVLSLKCPSI